MISSVPYRKRPLPVEDGTSGPTLCLTEAVVDAIGRLLPKRVGRSQHENVLYIAGVIEPMRRLGVTVIAPRADTGPGFYRTDRASHSEVIDLIGDLGLAVVAQVHCHPGAIVAHSEADDDLAFVRAEGHWSVVVPHYGLKGMLPLSGCGFHRFSNGVFSLLSEEAVARRVMILPQKVKAAKVKR